MINKKLLSFLKSEQKYLLGLIGLKIASLVVNIIIIFTIAYFIEDLIFSTPNYSCLLIISVLGGIGLLLIQKISSDLNYFISKEIKKKLRLQLFEKVYSLQYGYYEKISLAEISQLGVEGIEQLDIYFSKFIPQLIYSMIAPIILFFVLANIHFKIALFLLILIPLIPISIMMVQKLAKKTMENYWGSFVDLSQLFLDFLKGLATLKLFQVEKDKEKILNEKSKDFRTKTMKVLAVQLNNITVMDLIAFMGLAVGLLFMIYYFQIKQLSLAQGIVFTLLMAEFFLPLRMLGSFFHIAMNGIAASKKLMQILDLSTIKKRR